MREGCRGLRGGCWGAVHGQQRRDGAQDRHQGHCAPPRMAPPPGPTPAPLCVPSVPLCLCASVPLCLCASASAPLRVYFGAESAMAAV
eukprot:3884926-Rhodomonas_salina.1